MEIFLKYIVVYWEPIIAVLGFTISCFNLWYLLKNNKKNIEIKEVFYTKTRHNNKFYYEFNMILINKSRLPISIVDINFQNKGNIHSAKLDRMVISSINKDNDITTNFYSSEFPINLNGLEASKEMILFCLEEELEKEKIVFTIITSRGKLKKTVNYEGKNITINEYLDKILKNG